MLQLAETMSNDKPENGWFIPNCDDEKGSIVLDEANSAKRQLTRVPLFSTGQDKNVLQVKPQIYRQSPVKTPDIKTSK